MREEQPQPTSTSARVLWVDASAGVAGDMLLGALVDAGVPLDVVVAAVEAVLPAAVTVTARTVVRAGQRATKVDVAPRAGSGAEPVHELGTGDRHGHRTWADIRERLVAADLPSAVRRRAVRAFTALAEVEARAHGVEVADVHFHEVGAWDSVSDVVGVCAAVEHLQVTQIVVSRVAVGSGTVSTAHGVLAVPVPAVLGLAAGWEIAAVGEGELATPTGMALVTTLAGSQGPLPAVRVLSSGVGAGTKETPERANVVRVVLGTRTEPRAGSLPPDDLADAALVVLEANVDDLDPRVWQGVVDVLLAAGAADAWLTPILMKRGRPAHTLSVLARPEDVATLRDLVLTHTSTIGVRSAPVRRWALERSWVPVPVSGQAVQVKVAHRAGRIAHATPEFRDVEAAAAVTGRPVRDLLEEAVAAAVAAGLVPGAPIPADATPDALPGQDG